MDIRDSAGIVAGADGVLARMPGHKRLALIWAGVTTAVTVAVLTLSFLLDGQIADTGGLGGIGLRSVLSTAQQILSLLAALALPIWQLGYIRAMLLTSRQERAEPATLLDGFRRFGPVVRLMLLEAVLYVGLGMLCIYAGGMVLSMTPLAAPMEEFAQANADALLAGQLDSLDRLAMLKAMTPMLLGCGVLYGLMVIPLNYRLRLSRLLMMDDPGCGAMLAAMGSFRVMRGNCLALLRLDLRFWWFYAAQVAVAVVAYGDLLLPVLGVTLPFTDTVAYFLFNLVAHGLQLLLMWQCCNRVQVSYCRFYDGLLGLALPEPEKA